jgi:hypothetical protein
MPDSISIGAAYRDQKIVGGDISTTPVAATTLTSSGNTALAGASSTLGFFGVTPIVRRAGSGTPDNQIALTAALASVTVTGAYGFALSSGFSAMIAQLEEIRAALVAYGILTGP